MIIQRTLGSDRIGSDRIGFRFSGLLGWGGGLLFTDISKEHYAFILNGWEVLEGYEKLETRVSWLLNANDVHIPSRRPESSKPNRWENSNLAFDWNIYFSSKIEKFSTQSVKIPNVKSQAHFQITIESDNHHTTSTFFMSLFAAILIC